MSFINNFVPEYFPTSQSEFVAGTRNVVLKNEDQEGFHGKEQFRYDVAKTLEVVMEDAA